MRSAVTVLLLLASLGGTEILAQAGPTAKSPSRATVYSVLATVLPVGAAIAIAAGKDVGEGPVVAAGILGAVGIGIGPSVGHLYAGRMGLLLPRILAAGTLVLLGSQSDDWNTGGQLVLLGGAAAITMAVIDIARADNAARAWNADHRVVSVWVAPVPMAGRTRVGAGISLHL